MCSGKTTQRSQKVEIHEKYVVAKEAIIAIEKHKTKAIVNGRDNVEVEKMERWKDGINLPHYKRLIDESRNPAHSC